MRRDSSVSHDRREKTPEAKTLWFRSLGIADRMQMLCDLTDLALSINPTLLEKKRVEPTSGRVQVILPQFIEHGGGAARQVDLNARACGAFLSGRSGEVVLP